MHLEKQAQVKALLFDEAFFEGPTEYFNYNNIFLAENKVELSKNSKISEYAIKLDKDKQLFFKSIYNLEPMELKTLKTYIKSNLAIGFI